MLHITYMRVVNTGCTDCLAVMASNIGSNVRRFPFSHRIVEEACLLLQSAWFGHAVVRVRNKDLLDRELNEEITERISVVLEM